MEDPEHPVKVSRTADKCAVYPVDGREKINGFPAEQFDILCTRFFSLFPGEIDRFFSPVYCIDFRCNRGDRERDLSGPAPDICKYIPFGKPEFEKRNAITSSFVGPPESTIFFQSNKGVVGINACFKPGIGSPSLLGTRPGQAGIVKHPGQGISGEGTK